jgi:hypothetical protein
MLPLLEEEARKRQATSEAGVYGGKPLRTKLPEAVSAESPQAPTPAETGRARTIAAKAVGVGESSVDRASDWRNPPVKRKLKKSVDHYMNFGILWNSNDHSTFHYWRSR